MVEKVKTVRQLGLGDYMWRWMTDEWKRLKEGLLPTPTTLSIYSREQALPLEQRHPRDLEISSSGHFKVNPSQGGYPYRRWIVHRD